jgi:hypothetical protein
MRMEIAEAFKKHGLGPMILAQIGYPTGGMERMAAWTRMVRATLPFFFPPSCLLFLPPLLIYSLCLRCADAVARSHPSRSRSRRVSAILYISPW